MAREPEKLKVEKREPEKLKVEKREPEKLKVEKREKLKVNLVWPQISISRMPINLLHRLKSASQRS